MARYLFHAKYSASGVKGLLAEGGSSRRKAIDELSASLGGKVESFDFAFGATDVFVVIDLPTPESAASFALTVGAAGAASITTTVLLTPEQIDVARHLTPAYRAPGT